MSSVSNPVPKHGREAAKYVAYPQSTSATSGQKMDMKYDPEEKLALRVIVDNTMGCEVLYRIRHIDVPRIEGLVKEYDAPITIKIQCASEETRQDVIQFLQRTNGLLEHYQPDLENRFTLKFSTFNEVITRPLELWPRGTISVNVD